MSEQRFDIERIKQALVKATAPGSPFTQRSLDTAAGVSRGTVGEILRGKNSNPTSQVLSKLAHALGSDVSVFGLSFPRADMPTEADLHRALLEVLPGMPRGALDKRARYLAETVSQLLRLPPEHQAKPIGEMRQPDVPPKVGPLPEATKLT